jgi:hypothetical protein
MGLLTAGGGEGREVRPAGGAARRRLKGAADAHGVLFGLSAGGACFFEEKQN